MYATSERGTSDGDPGFVCLLGLGASTSRSLCAHKIQGFACSSETSDDSVILVTSIPYLHTQEFSDGSGVLELQNRRYATPTQMDSKGVRPGSRGTEHRSHETEPGSHRNRAPEPVNGTSGKETEKRTKEPIRWQGNKAEEMANRDRIKRDGARAWKQNQERESWSVEPSCGFIGRVARATRSPPERSQTEPAQNQ